MKRIWIGLVVVMIALTGAAMAQQNDALVEQWIEQCGTNRYDNVNYLKQSFEKGEYTINDKKAPVGMTIDGWDVDADITDYLSSEGIEIPCSAETLLIHYPIPKGAQCWTAGILEDVDYRYGESEVKLIGSCVKGFTERYDDMGWDSVMAIYEFEVKTGDKVYDVIAGSTGGPELSIGLAAGSDTLSATDGSTDIIGEKEVANCEEWISMRVAPDTKAERIRKVPRYGIVLAYKTQGEFTACNYDGVDGWVLTKYLVDPQWENTLADYEAEYLKKHTWRG